jgi:putative transposase
LFLSFRYRIYPLSHQLVGLNHLLKEMTFLWNYALAQRWDGWHREHRSVTYLEQQARLKEWRSFDVQGLGTVPYNIARDCLQRLDLGYRAAFRRLREGHRRAGFPRFRHETHSLTFVPSPDPIISGRAGTWRIKVPAIGSVPIRRHRPPPAEGTAKAATLMREADGWYTTIQYEIPDPAPPPTAEPKAPVGIDVGLSQLATLSTGEIIKPPRFYRMAERRLRREQRKLSRRRRGSGRNRQQRERVGRHQARVRHQRQWLAHQLSHDWAEQFDLVCFEDTDIAEFTEGNSLAKGINDAGWGRLRRMTAYKETLRSGRSVEVPARGTTQTCSGCGRIANPPLTLKDRMYRCPCGHTMDRDLNAARNILARGLDIVKERLRPSRAEVTRVESRPPPSRGGRRVYQRRRADSVKREASRNRPDLAQALRAGADAAFRPRVATLGLGQVRMPVRLGSGRLRSWRRI